MERDDRPVGLGDRRERRGGLRVERRQLACVGGQARVVVRGVLGIGGRERLGDPRPRTARRSCDVEPQVRVDRLAGLARQRGTSTPARSSAERDDRGRRAGVRDQVGQPVVQAEPVAHDEVGVGQPRGRRRAWGRTCGPRRPWGRGCSTGDVLAADLRRPGPRGSWSWRRPHGVGVRGRRRRRRPPHAASERPTTSQDERRARRGDGGSPAPIPVALARRAQPEQLEPVGRDLEPGLGARPSASDLGQAGVVDVERPAAAPCRSRGGGGRRRRRRRRARRRAGRPARRGRGS